MVWWIRGEMWRDTWRMAPRSEQLGRVTVVAHGEGRVKQVWMKIRNPILDTFEIHFWISKYIDVKTGN